MRIQPFLTSCRSSVSGALALVAALLVAACSGTPTAPTPQAPPPPTLSLTCPADIARESPDGSAVNVTWPTLIPTGGVNPITVACGSPSGNMFPVGETEVVCRASDTSLQQASCTFKVTVTRQPRLSRTSMIAFGDSMTEGIVSDPQSGVFTADGFPAFTLQLRPQASYPTRLQEKLRARYVAQGTEVRVLNRGIAGERVEDGVFRMQDTMNFDRPQVVLLLHGANNMGGPFPNTRSYIIEKLSEMMQEARFRGARVFVATIPPPRQSGGKAIPLSSVLDLNHHIRLLAAGEGARLVDLYGALNQDVNRYIGIDGLHPTEAGYQRMADEFYEAIKADLELR